MTPGLAIPMGTSQADPYLAPREVKQSQDQTDLRDMFESKELMAILAKLKLKQLFLFQQSAQAGELLKWVHTFMIIKRFRSGGFSLIEIVVVIAIFGIISVVASNFLVSIIQSSNRTSVENEIRENASRMIEDIASTVRSSGCVQFDDAAGTLSAYSDSLCAILLVTYRVDSSGVLMKAVGAGSEAAISSTKVAACGEPDPCVPSGNCTPKGLVISSVDGKNPTNRAVTIKLTVRSKSISTRKDFCAKVSLENTVSPRNSLN